MNLQFCNCLPGQNTQTTELVAFVSSWLSAWQCTIFICHSATLWLCDEKLVENTGVCKPVENNFEQLEKERQRPLKT
jgi:hypothetical protein